MRTLVQHAFLDHEDYDTVDSLDWPALPKKALPDGTNSFDQLRGWITCFNVQGIIFEHMDHYGVEHVDDETIRAFEWCDDPEDHLTDFHARVWTIKTPAPDPRFGNRIFSRQSFVGYAEYPRRRLSDIHNPTCNISHPWEEFIPPPENITRHGIWIPKEIMDTAKSVRRATSFWEWVE